MTHEVHNKFSFFSLHSRAVPVDISLIEEAVTHECLRFREQEFVAVGVPVTFRTLERLDADGRVLCVEQGEYGVLSGGIGAQG